MTVEKNVTVARGCSTQVELLTGGKVLLAPVGVNVERVPVRRSLELEGVNGVVDVSIGIDEFEVGTGKLDEGPVPVGPVKMEEFVVGKGKLADGEVLIGPVEVERLELKDEKLAEGAGVVLFVLETPVLKGTEMLEELVLEVIGTLETPVLRGIEMLELLIGVVNPLETGCVPVRRSLEDDPENVLGAVPVGPVKLEALVKGYEVVTGVTGVRVPERFPPLDEPENGLEVVSVALVDGEGDPLGVLVTEGGI